MIGYPFICSLHSFWPALFQWRISAVRGQAACDKASWTFLQRLNRFDTPTINHCTAWIAGCAAVDQSLSEFKTASQILLPEAEGSARS
jgi:hypothetical protein